MYRGSGLVTLSVAALVVFLLAFTSFDEPVPRWTRPEEGGGFVQVEIECPSAWSALVGGERIETNIGTEAERCVRAARTHLTAAIIVAAVGGAIGLRAVWRGPAPIPEPLRPLSEVINRGVLGAGARTGPPRD